MESAKSLCEECGITPEELDSRLAFLSFSKEDQRNVQAISLVIREHVDEMITVFYEHLNRFEELREILSEPGLMQRLKLKQRDYLLTLGDSVGAQTYAEGRLRIGLVHERVGLKQKWYLGAYSLLFRVIVQQLATQYKGDVPRLVSLMVTVDKLLRFDEIFVVDTYYRATTQRLAESLQQLNSAHEELKQVARLDPLTRVNNRRALLEQLEMELQRCRRYHHPFTVLFLDVDHFKVINDRFGHVAGDMVLQRIMQLAGSLTRPPDIVGRYGGEEFAIGLVECDLTGARPIAERIRSAIEQLVLSWEGQRIAVTVSIGLAVLTPDIEKIERLIDRADRALYEAKASGRNRIEVYKH
jgi:diguanylate cyclase (GGDEF)-like protein